jgi:hypothetical protein
MKDSPDGAQRHPGYAPSGYARSAETKYSNNKIAVQGWGEKSKPQPVLLRRASLAVFTPAAGTE